LLEFYFGSADNNEAINGYTELAFELVWLCSLDPRFGVKSKLFLRVWKSLEDRKAELAG